MVVMKQLLFPFRIPKIFVGGYREIASYKRSFRNCPTTSEEEDVEGKVVIVTGGSSGLGKASAKEFAKRGAIVVIGDVDLKNGEITVEDIRKETGNLNVSIMKLDLSDMDSVEEFAKNVSLQYPKIKIILNNAGITGWGPTNVITKDGFNIHVAINYMGHFLLTNLLLENLKAEEKSRVVCMSSTMSLFSYLDIEDINMQKPGIGFRFALPYCNTKFCISLFAKELAKRMEGTGITAYSLCPTIVRTNIYSILPTIHLAPIRLLMRIQSYTPEEAASQFIMHCALDKNIESDTGKMFRVRKPFAYANKRLDSELACRLWEKSSELLNLQERLTRMPTQNASNNVIKNIDP